MEAKNENVVQESKLGLQPGTTQSRQWMKKTKGWSKHPLPWSKLALQSFGTNNNQRKKQSRKWKIKASFNCHHIWHWIVTENMKLPLLSVSNCWLIDEFLNTNKGRVSINLRIVSLFQSRGRRIPETSLWSTSRREKRVISRPPARRIFSSVSGSL